MAGPVPAIHVFLWLSEHEDVDARGKPGHDELGASALYACRQSSLSIIDSALL
jgi:hypothetical protein